MPLRLRRNARARRIILRIDTENEGVVVTLPPRTSEAEARALARDKAGWISARLAKLPPRRRFTDGASVPVLGFDHLIRHVPAARHGVRRRDGVILVSGQSEHLARRLTDWLKAEARREIAPRVDELAADIGKIPGRITIRDTSSRWGSCSASGNLSFCWRLIMTPPAVFDYVIAHEVAHLAAMNHGPKFWRIVTGLGVDAELGRAWLRRNGEALHRYG